MWIGCWVKSLAQACGVVQIVVFSANITASQQGSSVNRSQWTVCLQRFLQPRMKEGMKMLFMLF